jgi:uncharacterized protein (TIGR03083 family)
MSEPTTREADVATDDEMVVMLGAVWASIGDLGAGLTEPEWKSPTEVPGWTVQDNLAHIAGIEASLLDRPPPAHSVPDDLPHVKNDFGALNEVFVDSRRSLTGADVLAEFREVTGERIAELRAAGPDDFAADTWTPVGPGAVRDLLPFRVFDSWVHEQDMRRAVQKPGHLDGPVAELAFERIISTVPFVVGKKAGAPERATIVFEFSGPMARTFAVAVEGGRARVADPAPPSPTTRIATDTETFARVATGRVAPGEALAAGRFTFEGDDALGRRVVEELNFLF